MKSNKIEQGKNNISLTKDILDVLKSIDRASLTDDVLRKELNIFINNLESFYNFDLTLEDLLNPKN